MIKHFSRVSQPYFPCIFLLVSSRAECGGNASRTLRRLFRMRLRPSTPRDPSHRWMPRHFGTRRGAENPGTRRSTADKCGKYISPAGRYVLPGRLMGNPEACPVASTPGPKSCRESSFLPRQNYVLCRNSASDKSDTPYLPGKSDGLFTYISTADFRSLTVVPVSRFSSPHRPRKSRPGRVTSLMRRGLQQRGELELRLGYYLAVNQYGRRS